MKTEQLMIHGLTIELTRKKIKNLHLRVYAPHGQIRMTAPLHVKEKEIKDVIHSRLEWIKTQQQKTKDFFFGKIENLYYFSINIMTMGYSLNSFLKYFFCLFGNN